MSATIKQALQRVQFFFATVVPQFSIIPGAGLSVDTIRALNELLCEVDQALKRYAFIIAGHDHIDVNGKGFRESLDILEDENSNLRKLLFEAIKRLPPKDMAVLLQMVSGKTIAEGGFTTGDLEWANIVDDWRTTTEKLCDLIDAVKEAPTSTASGAAKFVPMLTDQWLVEADAILNHAREYGTRMQREKTLEELLQMKGDGSL